MQDEIKVSEGYQPAHQFISFVEGSSSEAPNPSSYPLQVLEADHNLNYLDGGDPTDGFSPWVTDILVYPSSEYWEGLLESGKVRPYVDFSISNYNTLRIPSAIHNYDLYVDDARIYGDLTIDGDTNLSGTVQVTGELQPASISIQGGFSVNNQGDLTANNISGVGNTRALIEATSDASYTFDATDTGLLLVCDPIGASTSITLPSVADDGTVLTVQLISAGKNVTITNLSNAKGNQLTEQYSSATLYHLDGSWYGLGDLV
jgi:hypothetical protein